MGAQFIDYDAISDRIFWLASNISLNFTVKLGKKDKEGNRLHYHKEIEYASNYLNTNSVISIKRSFDYFFTIESTDNKSIYIQIRLENMIMLQNVLQEVLNSLFDQSRWSIKNKRLVTIGNFAPSVLPGLPMNKWLSFEPIVYEYNSGEFNKGVRITLSDYNLYIDIDIDKFMGLVYLINSFNMYQAASTMINYLHWNEYGTNLVQFAPDTNEQNEGLSGAMKANRTIPKPKQTKSFFDIKNELDNM